MMSQTFKRAIDIGVAAIGLLLFAPVMLATATAIRLCMGSPVFFCQMRPGLREKPFKLVKFRTMRSVCSHDGNLLSDRERITRLGRWLRSTSLDELPQLWNVLLGQLSLVGPRPLLMEYLGRYSPKHQRRHRVRPGITGLAQISGRQGIPVSQRLDLDVWYVDHWSLGLDIKILCKTVWSITRATNVNLEVSCEELDDVGLHPHTPINRTKSDHATPIGADQSHAARAQ